MNKGILSRTEEANFKNRMSKYKEQATLYAQNRIIDGQSVNTVNFGTVVRDLIQTEEITDIDEESINDDISSVLTNISKAEKLYCIIYKGDLTYVSREDMGNTEKQCQWCKEIGIPILELQMSTGMANRDGDYQLVNGIYICTPDVKDNFNPMITRYFNVSSDGKTMIPGSFIKSIPADDWYDYSNKKWANICVEYGGVENYYVWIPRYCYKIVGEETDIKFIDTDDSYTDETGTKTEWAILEGAGYKIPDAFYWDGNGNNTKDAGEELPGYWAMKYVIGETSDSAPKVINYDMSVSKGKLLIKNIVTDSAVVNTNPVANYSFIVNGNASRATTIEADKINSTNIMLDGLKIGENYVTVAALNADGGMVGSMTKTISYDEPNAPQLKSMVDGTERYVFDPNNTFYVTWDVDNEGNLINEKSDIPISQSIDKYTWYDYGEKRWANIVTRNNGSEIYYVWIPRYQYKLDSNETTSIKFLKDTSSDTTHGYSIPDAFTFNGVPLKGYWAMKYVAQAQ